MTTNAFSIATKEMVFCLVDVLLRKMVIVIEFNVPLLHALNKYYLNQLGHIRQNATWISVVVTS